MKIVRTMKYKVKEACDALRLTLDIYRDAVAFLVDVYDKEWDSVSILSGKERQNYAEALVHRTKANPNPEYDFGECFSKFPSYLRRSAIAESLGIISSYKSNYANWEKELEEAKEDGERFRKKPPLLTFNHRVFPVFYKKNMSERISYESMKLKVYSGKDWVWKELSIAKKSKSLGLYKELNPSLVQCGKKFFLHIPYEAKVELKTEKTHEQVVVAVDLGLTNSAVCAAMKSDGTVIGRKFINQPIEKDRLMTRLGRLKKAQQRSCVNSKNKLPNHWRKINNLNRHIAQDTANQIIAFAESVNASLIVFEYLDKFKMPKGEKAWIKKQRLKLQNWMHKRVVEMAGRKANRKGMRYRRVNPKNTSSLAYDGSGDVKRNEKKDLAEFTSGKVYNADLNAAYNIGARYFIKKLLKSLSETRRLAVQAKVPELSFRTRCTLSTLIRLCEAM